MPDIGIRCGFSTEISQIYPGPGYQQFSAGWISPPDNASAVVEARKGDIVRQVGTQRVDLWPQLIRALCELQPSHSARTIQEAESDGQSYTTVGGEHWVRLIVDRPTGALRPERYAMWCRIDRLPSEELIPSIVWFCLKIGLFVIGAVVFWKRPNDQAAAQFFLLCIFTVGAYMGGYHWARIAARPSLLVVFMFCGVLLPAVSLHFYLIFPRPKPVLQRAPRRVLGTIYGIPLAFLVVILVGYFYVRQTAREPNGFDSMLRAWNILRIEIGAYLVVAAALYVLSVASLIYSFAHAQDQTERNQVKWIVFASLLALLPIGYTLYLVFWEREAFGAGKATWPMFGASVCFTLAFAISITRYRLLQLDQILSSGAVYFLLSISAGLVYYAVAFAGVLAANLVGAQLPGTSLGETIWVSASALLFLLMLNLARGRINKAFDRRFYRHKHQLDRTLQRLGAVIEQLVDPPTLARRLLQASADLLTASSGSVYLCEGEPAIYRLAGCLGPTPPPLQELTSGCPLVEALEKRRTLTTWPHQATDAAQKQLRFLKGEVAYALVHESQLLAFLILGPKDTGPYRPDDLNLLSGFAQIAAPALESARGHRTMELLNQELRTKVEKISEQQRRILALQSQLTNNAVVRSAASTVVASGQEQRSIAETKEDPFRYIVGSSPVLRQVLDTARKVASSPSAVLVRGESGTGKELLAKAIHESSSRSAQAYVRVHCAALSPGLLESELFGHVKGAFTGAHRDKVGRFELAHGGTLFLDEIGDINWELQTKLLRVLQEKMFERVGSNEAMPADVRVIAATSRNLEELIEQEKFREDLYYRLKVVDLTLPALRERREDIPELALHFLRIFAERTGRDLTQIDDEAMLILKSHRWRGNIRELQNSLEHAVAVAEGSVIMPFDLPRELLRGGINMDEKSDRHWNGVEPDRRETLPGARTERQERDRREREQLVRALAAADGNKARAARVMGLARSTLLSRLKKHGLA
jgi:transcriptional regulator with PAS, ATPase and Fis domain